MEFYQFYTFVSNLSDLMRLTWLREDVLNNLNEVVVTGYGTQRKSDLMGAVASIKS